jgi:hypothetical protein
MKKSFVMLSALVLIACVFGAANVNAQTLTLAFSSKVGYYTFDVQSGSNLIVSGLVTKKEFQGTISAVTSGGSTTTITLSSGSVTAGALDDVGGNPTHYVELVGHPTAEGLVCDVKSNTATQVVLHMTDPQCAAANLVVDDAVCIRSHVTLGNLYESAKAGTAPDVPAAGQDLVTLFDDTGGSTTFLYTGDAPTTQDWLNTGTGVSGDSQIVYPGQGMIYVSDIAKSLRVGGAKVSHVKDGPTRVPVYVSAINLVGQVNPLNGTAGTMGGLGLTDPVTGIEPGTDVVTLFNNIGGSFQQIAQYISNGSNLLNTGTGLNGDPDLIDFTEGILVSVGGTADLGLLLPSGITP